MQRARRWSIAGLCIGALALPPLVDGALDVISASAFGWRARPAPSGNCTSLALNRGSGLTTAAACPDDVLIRLEAANVRGAGGPGAPGSAQRLRILA